MPDFSELFEKSNLKPIVYQGKLVHPIEKYPVKDGDVLVASIESTNSDCLQGFSIDITGSCIIDGEHKKQGKGVKMLFWEDTAPKEIKLQVLTQENFVWVENIWETTDHRGVKSFSFGDYGSAMQIEEIENGRCYRCNDWHPDDDFDDIVFTIRTLKNKS